MLSVSSPFFENVMASRQSFVSRMALGTRFSISPGVRIWMIPNSMSRLTSAHQSRALRLISSQPTPSSRSWTQVQGKFFLGAA